MASLYNRNVMKSIVTISSACALAFAGMASAQDAPAPAPAPAAETPAAPAAPAAEVSKEAKEAADQMLALMKEMSATLSTVKDKATADAAAEKMAKINEKGEALSKSAQKVQAEMDAAMQARQAELLPPRPSNFLFQDCFSSGIAGCRRIFLWQGRLKRPPEV